MSSRPLRQSAWCLAAAGFVLSCSAASHLPVAETPQVARPAGVVHTVAAGQTLWRIARAYDVPLPELARANGIADPTRVTAGQSLFVPGARRVVDVPPYSPGSVASRPVPEGTWLWPVADGRVVSEFGVPRRSHRHAGIDIAGADGEAVHAARAGVVVHSGTGLRGYGNTVILDHGAGLQTLYAHNSDVDVRVGELVAAGQVIARLGHSGNASTTHCHFEIRRGSEVLDPLPLLTGEPQR